MISKVQVDEALEILQALMTALLSGISTSGRTGSMLRNTVGDILANGEELITGETLGTELLLCFDQARLAGATLDDMDRSRNAMVAESPIYEYGEAVKLVSIVFTLMTQSQIISLLTFTSRTDVEKIMTRMAATIEIVTLETAELLDGMQYQLVVQLSAALMQHLGATERQLPRVVKYTLPTNFPSLVIANKLYADATRSEELIAENRVIHPAFFPRNIVALSE